MSILKVNDIRRATTGSSTLVFNDPVTITSGTISASVLIGSLPGTVTIGDGTIGKEKLTNDARDWVNILNKPSGLLSSSAQIPGALSGSSIAVTNITSSGNITATGYFSGSGAYLYDIPNSALNNSTITINGVVTALGASRTLVTADVSESINLYYTDARVKSKLNTEGVFSSSGQVNYQAVQGQPSVNTLGSDGNNSFTVTAGIFLTGSTGINLTADSPNAKIILRTVGGTVSSSAQVKDYLPADTVSSSMQVKTFLPNGTVSASAQYPGWVTASSQIDYNSITNKLSGVVSSSAQVQPLLPADTVSSSIQVKVFLPGGSVSSSQQLPAGTVSASSQYPGWVTASSQIDVRNTTGIATIATTGSNTFSGNQTISGSISITGNLNVFGTSSVLYTTSSQLNVGTNKITIGTDQVLRFGGISIVDSGSIGRSGSLYWDSLNDRWLYEDVTGGQYTSAILVAGPKNVGTTGNERGLLTGRVPVASGDDHIDTAAVSSSIRVDFPSRLTHVEAGLYITGGLTVQGNISGNLVVPIDTVSSSIQIKAFLPADTVSASTQVKTFLPGGTVSSSAQYPGWVTASSQIDYNSITNKLSSVISSSTQVQPLLPAGTVSSSGQVTATSTTGFTAGVEQIIRDNNVHSGSFLGTATTNNLTEGFTNLYYTDTRVKTKLNADGVHSGSWLGSATTTNLTEGTNLYFTNLRVLNALPTNTVSSSNQINAFLPAGTVSSSVQVNLGQAFGTASRALTASFALAVSGTLATSTDGLPQGVTNLYYADSLVKTKLNADNVHSASFLGTATTTNLTEGINLYFTNARVLNALPIGTISSSTQIPSLLPSGVVSSSGQVDVRNTTGIATIATTGSNTFVGNQTITGSILTNADTLIFTGQMTLSGSLITTGSITNTQGGFTGSFSGSHTGTFPYGSLTGIPTGIVSSSTQVQSLLPGGTVSASIQYPGWVTASSQIDYNNIQNKLSGVVSSSTQVKPLLPDGTVSSSAQYPGWVTSSNQIDYNSITNKLSGVVSSSAQVQPLLPAGTVSSSGQVDYNSITNKLSGVYSSSTQAVAAIAGQTISPAIINATGAISGASIQTSGNGIFLGNVGIATTGSSYPLQIRRVAGGGSLGVTVDNVFGAMDRTTKYFAVGDSTSDTTGHVFYVRNGNATDSASLAIRYDGNVGIGITSPVTNLDVRGIIASSISNFTYSTFDGFTDGNLYITSNAGSANTTNSNIIFRSSTSGGSITERVRIDNAGNVGIGTPTPNAKLDINGNTTVTGSLIVTGRTEIAQVREKLNTKTGATGVVTHDYSTGAIFYHSSISANFTINLTNVPTDNDKTIAVTIILNQGVTGYYPSAFQIDGSAQTLRWANNETPTPSTSKVDVATFSLIRTGGAWIVLGNYTPFA